MKKIIFSLVLLGLTSASCTKMLDIVPPNQISEEQLETILKDPEKAAGLFTTIAGGLAADFFKGQEKDLRYHTWSTMNYMLSMQGNDVIFASRQLDWGTEQYNFQNVRGNNSGYNNFYWPMLYNKIGSANRLLNKLALIDNSKSTPATQKILWKNQAIGLATRAYNYTYLGWLYTSAYSAGPQSPGVPLRVKDNPFEAVADGTMTMGRGTIETLWKNFILVDAKQSVKLFTDAGIGRTGDPTDIDLIVAQGILARAAASCNEWDECITACDAIIAAYPAAKLMSKASYIGDTKKADGTTGTDGVPDYEQTGFTYFGNLKDPDVNTEVILGYPSSRSSAIAGRSIGGWTNNFADNGYAGSGTGFSAIDPRLYEVIDPADYRKLNFMSSDYGEYTYKAAGKTEYLMKYFNTKFGATKANPHSPSSVNTVQDDILMRASEFYLLKAEALAQKGDNAGAEAVLDIIIQARTENAKTTATYTWPADVTTTLEKVYLQTRIEMWGEMGSEYYNNKRWGKGVDRTSAYNGVTSGHTMNYVPADPAQVGRTIVVNSPIVFAGGSTQFVWQIPFSETNYNGLTAGQYNNP